AEKPMLLVNIDMPEGSSFDQTDAMTARVEALVRQHPLVVDIAANIGRGNPRVYYNTMPSRQTVKYAQLFVSLSSHELAQVEPLGCGFSHQLMQIPGAQITGKE